jgi:lipopolysaccharide transport protein LptA
MSTWRIVHVLRRWLAFCLGRLLLFLLLASFSSFAAQPALTGRISGGFQAPTSTDTQGRRHVLKGTNAEPRGDNIFLITEPRVTSYNADDTPDMFIESPRCLYDMKSNLASSDSRLSVRTADGRFAIEGIGWRWDPGAALLSISNQVAALVQESSLSGLSTNAAAATNKPIHITSTRFLRDADSASFLEQVLVRDATNTLTCDRLNLELGKGGVQKIEALQNVHLDQGDTKVISGSATYDLKENIIRITKQPKWALQSREGSAELLIVNRSNNTFFAEGKVYMKLPVTNVVAQTLTNAPSTNQFVEITSDKFTYQNAMSNRPALAIYTDHVRILRNDASIECDRLIANFDASNRVTHVKAEQNVSITDGPNKAFGNEGNYDFATEKVTLTGHPHWTMGDKTGHSDTMIFLTKTQELLALGHVELVLPGESVSGVFQFSPSSNRVAQTNGPMTIQAKSLSHAENVAVFQGGVQASDSRGTIDCELLTVVTGASNQVQRIIADKGVSIKQQDLAALGEKAEYNAQTGLLRLTGKPELIMPDKTLRADEFIIDRRKNTFSVSPGKYVMRVQARRNEKGKGLNGLR